MNGPGLNDEWARDNLSRASFLMMGKNVKRTIGKIIFAYGHGLNPKAHKMPNCKIWQVVNLCISFSGTILT